MITFTLAMSGLMIMIIAWLAVLTKKISWSAACALVTLGIAATTVSCLLSRDVPLAVLDGGLTGYWIWMWIAQRRTQKTDTD